MKEWKNERKKKVRKKQTENERKKEKVKERINDRKKLLKIYQRLFFQDFEFFPLHVFFVLPFTLFFSANREVYWCITN